MSISVVITSYNRLDLLQKTVSLLEKYLDYPISKFIIIEDSANREMYYKLTRMYPKYILILNDENIGAYESIDKAYSLVETPYVLHVEDDWLFYKGGFIKQAIAILESNPKIMQVNLSNEQRMPIEPQIFYAGDIDYRLVGKSECGWWDGFTCNPSVRSMAGYEKTKPWTQWIDKNKDLSIQECMVGMRYTELGYKAAILNNYYCTHIGIGRGTWQSK
jgi:glycosyltransferase involved in cell wall biosynthesis